MPSTSPAIPYRVAIAASVMNDQDPEKESRLDHSPSRFTAVNGGEPLEDTSATTPSNGDNRGAAEFWSRDRNDTTPHREENLKGIVDSGKDINGQRSQRPTPHSTPILSSQVKRKRSESVNREPRSPAQPSNVLGAHSPQAGNSNGIMSSQSDGEAKRASPQATVRRDEGETPRRPSTNAIWHEYDAQLVSQPQRIQQVDPSDAQMAEVLQREAQSSDVVQKDWDSLNRQIEGSVSSEQVPASSFSQDQTQDAVQIAPKRKRVFSNRTKTGCMTCRRRKKKCDEQHPVCKYAGSYFEPFDFMFLCTDSKYRQ